jgi:CRP-like cAMP-binding protein
MIANRSGDRPAVAQNLHARAMSGLGSDPQKSDPTFRSKTGELLMRDVYEKDKIIFREGQDGTDTFVVESGRIGVFKTAEGKQIRLAVLEKGAMFGEMAVITGAKRGATTIALEQSVVVRISRTMVQQKIAACDPFIKALIQILMNNLNRVNERYALQNKVADKLLADLRASAPKTED